MATAHSTRSDLDQWRKWKKQHASFPLSVRANGQWGKKVLGRIHHFGPLDDPDAALRRWLSAKDHLLAGEEPPEPASGLSIREICLLFADNAEARRDRGELDATSYRHFIFASKFILEHLGKSKSASTLSPRHFAELRQAVAKTGRNLRSQKNLIIDVRAIFRWAKRMHYIETVEFGPEFRPPNVDAIEREHEKQGTRRFFDREDLLAILETCRPKFKAQVLLGINCGFQGHDVQFLTLARLHLDSEIPYHDFRRVKKPRRRMAALWPETVEALRYYLNEVRPESSERIVFLDRSGKPTVNPRYEGVLTQSLDLAFKRAGRDRPKGAGFGSLRHTLATVLDLSNDTKMTNLIMGHKDKTIRQRHYVQFNLSELTRLKKVSDIVHRWLFDGEVE